MNPQQSKVILKDLPVNKAFIHNSRLFIRIQEDQPAKETVAVFEPLTAKIHYIPGNTVGYSKDILYATTDVRNPNCMYHTACFLWDFLVDQDIDLTDEEIEEIEALRECSEDCEDCEDCEECEFCNDLEFIICPTPFGIHIPGMRSEMTDNCSRNIPKDAVDLTPFRAITFSFPGDCKATVTVDNPSWSWQNPACPGGVIVVDVFGNEHYIEPGFISLAVIP